MLFSQVIFFLKEVYRNIIRNSWMSIAAITIVTLSLAVFGIFLVILFNINFLFDTILSQLEITAYLRPKITKKEIFTIRRELLTLPGVTRVKFISREEALHRIEAMLHIELASKRNPLPNSLEIRVKNPDYISVVVEKLKSFSAIEKVNYGQQLTEKLVILARTIKIIGLIISLILLIITLVIISNTIRLTVLARSDEIEIMQLVGATSWFIKWPFLLEGLFYGLLGSILSISLLVFFYKGISARVQAILPFLPVINASEVSVPLGIILIITGISIGVLGSSISVSKCLKI